MVFNQFCGVFSQFSLYCQGLLENFKYLLTICPLNTLAVDSIQPSGPKGKFPSPTSPCGEGIPEGYRNLKKNGEISRSPNWSIRRPISRLIRPSKSSTIDLIQPSGSKRASALPNLPSRERTSGDCRNCPWKLPHEICQNSRNYQRVIY